MQKQNGAASAPPPIAQIHTPHNAAAFMRDDLARSGLVVSDLNASVAVEPFTQQPHGYTIPYWLPDGTPHPVMHRVRLMQPLPGKGKYSQPDKTAFSDGTYPYLSPANALAGLLRGPSTPPLIVEGEKKAVAAIKHLQRVAYGIGGCWNWCRTTPEGLHQLHPELGGRFIAGEIIDVVLDGDLMLNTEIQRAAGTLRRRLLGAGFTPRFVLLPARRSRAGLDDWLMDCIGAGLDANQAFNGLPRTDGADFAEAAIDAWNDLKLPLSAKGLPIPNEDTVDRVLTGHGYYSRLRFNATMKRMELTLPSGRDLHNDEIPPFITTWLQRRLCIPKASIGTVRNVLSALCNERSPLAYNAVHGHLQQCAAGWDNTPRVDRFLIDVLRIADTPYHRAVSRAFFLGAARRGMQPGCKMDYVLILSGKGGIGKTTFFQHLAMNAEWLKEVTEPFDRSKDGRMALARGWIVEASEGVAIDLASAGGMKAIITDCVDEFRPPYATSLQRFPRATVIVASTNDDTVLKYEAGSGNRRFLPISVSGHIDLSRVDAEIAQVWGEAAQRVAAGEREWEGLEAAGPTLEELSVDAVNAHTEVDPWVEDLAAYLQDVTHLHRRVWAGTVRKSTVGLAVSSRSLLTDALHLTPDRKLASHGKRLRRAMQSIPGWERIDTTDTVSGQTVRFAGYWRADDNVV